MEKNALFNNPSKEQQAQAEIQEFGFPEPSIILGERLMPSAIPPLLPRPRSRSMSVNENQSVIMSINRLQSTGTSTVLVLVLYSYCSGRTVRTCTVS